MTNLDPTSAADASASPMLVNFAAYDRDGLRTGDFTVDQISDVLEQPGQFVWLGLHEPDEALLDKIQDEFHLHDLAIEDAHHAHQRPKVEAYGDSLFIVLQTAQFVNGKIAFGETHLFLGVNYLVSVRHGASLSYTPARMRCEQSPELLAMGPSFGLYAIFDFVVDNFQPIVGSFQSELEALENDIFGANFSRDVIERLYDLKKELVTLRLAVAPLQDMLNQLVRFHPGLIHEPVRIYFRDVYDHAVRVKENCDTMSEMLSAAMSVNLALVSVGQGEVVRRLAGWAALLGIPTLIASWYGMNFEHMPELTGRLSYGAVIGVTALACLGVYTWLRRAKWL